MTSTLINKGIIDEPSNHTVEETVDRLKHLLQSKGVTLFALDSRLGNLSVPGF
jgi:hypothetical protein